MTKHSSRYLLVAGAEGEIGRRVVELLSRHDALRVTATARNSADIVDLAARGVRIRAADPDDAASLDAAFPGAQRLLLVSTAADGLWGRHRQLKALVAAASRAGVQSVVYMAQVDMFDPSPTLLERDCSVVETACNSHGLSSSVLRMAWPIEELFPRIALALRYGKWLSTALQGRLPYVSVEDAASTVVAVLMREEMLPHHLNITGSRALTPEMLIDCINVIFGAQVELVPASDEVLALHLQASGFSKSATMEALAMDALSRLEVAQYPSDAVRQVTGKSPLSIEAVLAKHRLDLLLSSVTPKL